MIEMEFTQLTASFDRLTLPTITYSTPILHLINAIRGDWLWVYRATNAGRTCVLQARRPAGEPRYHYCRRSPPAAVAPAALGEGLQQRLSAGLHADEVLLKLDEVAKRPIVDAVLDVSWEDRRNNAAAVLIGLIDGRGAHRPISCNQKGRARSRTAIAVHGTSAISSKSRTACDKIGRTNVPHGGQKNEPRSA
ncbi:hypothetical protein ACVWZZ_001421 [Bradyrhizobium sp. LM6.10]